MTTTTRTDGSYRFDSVDLGTYTVSVKLPMGWVQTTAAPAINVTRGMTVVDAPLGVKKLVNSLTSPLLR